MRVKLLCQPRGPSVGDVLITELASGHWDRFQCAVAFAKLSGVQFLDAPLRAFTGGGGEAELGIGVDSEGTSFEAVNQLAGAVADNGRLVVVKHLTVRGYVSFHPKAYLFSNQRSGRALAIVGSSNITEGGLFKNYELSTALEFDRKNRVDARLLAGLRREIETWHGTSGLAIRVDSAALADLEASGWLPSEKEIDSTRAKVRKARGTKRASRPPRGLEQQPSLPRPAHPKGLGAPLLLPPEGRRKPGLAPHGLARARHDAFFIDVTTQTDTTEIYLSKRAINDDPMFFGHPFKGRNKPKKPGNAPQPELAPRPNVDLRILGNHGGEIMVLRNHRLRVWEYVKGKNKNADVRLTVPQEMRAKLRSYPDCILEMRRRPIRPGVVYRLDFLTPGSARWAAARAAAVELLPNSTRRYGWG